MSQGDASPVGQVSGSHSLMSGSFSGMMAAAATQPLEVARTMMQKAPAAGSRRLTTLGSLTEVIREGGGVSALWRGNVPSMIRVGGGAGMWVSLIA